jgi:hypothetical protein
MRLKDHYKFHSRKSLKPYKSLLLLVLFTITIFHTFGRYSSISTANSAFDIAKWLLKINEEKIESSTSNLSSSIKLVNSADGTTNIDVGDECYFDIIINPDSTEVDVKYIISIDLEDSNSTLPAGTIIKKYEKYNVSNSKLLFTANVNNTSITIEDNINLENKEIELKDTDSVKYRIYCQMPDFADLVKNQRLSVKPSIIVQQILNDE